MKKLGLLVLVMLGFTQLSSTAEDYSKMSTNELSEALIIAVRKDFSDEVQELVRAGADVNQNITYVKFDGCAGYDIRITCTLLEYAAAHGYTDTVRKLILVNADDINRALIVAAEEGHTNAVRELIQAKPKVDSMNAACIAAAKNFPGNTKDTATGLRDRTVLKDYLNVIKELIKAGANVNHTSECEYGDTVLIKFIKCVLYTEAQKKNRAEVIQVLLEAKANVNHANKKGETALVVAVRDHEFYAVQKLIQAGANVNQNITYSVNDYRKTATCTLLEYAAARGYADIVKELVSVDKNDDISKALIVAAREGHANLVRELIQAGANVNHAEDWYGETAFFRVIRWEAQKKNRAEIIQVLLKAGANVNHVTNFGRTALIVAIEKHDVDAVQVLLQTPEININYADRSGNTALIHAVKQCQFLSHKDGASYRARYLLDSTKILEKLLQTPGINFHHVNNYGDSAITLMKEMKETMNY